MKKALLILAIAFAALQTAQPANAYYPYGGGYGGGGYGGYGNGANFAPVGGPGFFGGGGPGMMGSSYGRPGFFGGGGGCGYRHYHRHWRRW